MVSDTTTDAQYGAERRKSPAPFSASASVMPIRIGSGYLSMLPVHGVRRKTPAPAGLRPSTGAMLTE